MSIVTPSHQAGSMNVLMDLLADPAKLQDRVEQLKKAEESAKEQIALVGPANEILQIRAEIEELKKEAAEAAQKAQVEAEAIIDEANNTAMEVMADAEAEASRVKLAAAEEKQNADSIIAGARNEASAVQREKQVNNARASELDHREERLQQRADDLDQRDQELTEEKKKLADLRELISQAL